jgi:hypothetical protein
MAATKPEADKPKRKYKQSPRMKAKMAAKAKAAAEKKQLSAEQLAERKRKDGINAITVGLPKDQKRRVKRMLETAEDPLLYLQTGLPMLRERKFRYTDYFQRQVCKAEQYKADALDMRLEADELTDPADAPRKSHLLQQAQRLERFEPDWVRFNTVITSIDEAERKLANTIIERNPARFTKVLIQLIGEGESADTPFEEKGKDDAVGTMFSSGGRKGVIKVESKYDGKYRRDDEVAAADKAAADLAGGSE